MMQRRPRAWSDLRADAELAGRKWPRCRPRLPVPLGSIHPSTLEPAVHARGTLPTWPRSRRVRSTSSTHHSPRCHMLQELSPSVCLVLPWQRASSTAPFSICSARRLGKRKKQEWRFAGVSALTSLRARHRCTWPDEVNDRRRRQLGGALVERRRGVLPSARAARHGTVLAGPVDQSTAPAVGDGRGATADGGRALAEAQREAAGRRRPATGVQRRAAAGWRWAAEVAQQQAAAVGGRTALEARQRRGRARAIAR